MKIPKILVFASGEAHPEEGGSGFEKLVQATKSKVLQAEIVAVVSQHEYGGVRNRAFRLKIPFEHSPRPRTAQDYQNLVAKYEADFVALSGWLGFVEGLDPRRTFNIHPAWDLQRFGGKNFYGHKVHEAVIEAYRRGEVTHSGITMHFVTEKYDDPTAVFFSRKLEILPDDDAGSLGKRVNVLEHQWQTFITNRVIHGLISWDGKNPSSI